MGSPPQVRGKLLGNWVIAEGLGITPAGAGKTSEAVLMPKKIQDHPRRCGENLSRVGKLSATPGSPPQVRGKQNVP